MINRYGQHLVLSSVKQLIMNSLLSLAVYIFSCCLEKLYACIHKQGQQQVRMPYKKMIPVFNNTACIVNFWCFHTFSTCLSTFIFWFTIDITVVQFTQSWFCFWTHAIWLSVSEHEIHALISYDCTFVHLRILMKYDFVFVQYKTHLNRENSFEFRRHEYFFGLNRWIMCLACG